MKVWIVLFLDALGSMSHLHAFTWDSDMQAIEDWAKAKIAAERAPFPGNPGNRSLPERHVIYGAEVDSLHVLKTAETRRARD